MAHLTLVDEDIHSSTPSLWNPPAFCSCDTVAGNANKPKCAFARLIITIDRVHSLEHMLLYHTSPNHKSHSIPAGMMASLSHLAVHHK